MGYELRRQLRNALGSDVVGLQRAIALEIADDASDGSRESWASLEDLARWTAAKDPGVVRNALKRLAAAGWEFRVPMGVGKDGRTLYAVPGRRLTFRVPEFEGGAVALSEGATAPPKEEPGLSLVDAKGGAGAPTEGAGAPTEGAGAPSQGAGAPPFSSSPHLLSPSLLKSTEPDRFEEFWSTYPRKIAKGNGRKAWTAAMKRKADPELIVQAAKTHAAAWRAAGTEPQWIPHPSTWLNGERYDDPTTDLPKPASGPAPRAPWTDPAERGTF